jgi:hypothetical protein
MVSWTSYSEMGRYTRKGERYQDMHVNWPLDISLGLQCRCPYRYRSFSDGAKDASPAKAKSRTSHANEVQLANQATALNPPLERLLLFRMISLVVLVELGLSEGDLS